MRNRIWNSQQQQQQFVFSLGSKMARTYGLSSILNLIDGRMFLSHLRCIQHCTVWLSTLRLLSWWTCCLLGMMMTRDQSCTFWTTWHVYRRYMGKQVCYSVNYEWVLQVSNNCFLHVRFPLVPMVTGLSLLSVYWIATTNQVRIATDFMLTCPLCFQHAVISTLSQQSLKKET